MGEAAWEAMCDPAKGCLTKCCSYEGSYCRELEWVDEAHKIGRCRVYATRFGLRHTVDGTAFQCVPMTTKLKIEGVPHPLCGYAVVRTIKGIPVVRGQP